MEQPFSDSNLVLYGIVRVDEAISLTLQTRGDRQKFLVRFTDTRGIKVMAGCDALIIWLGNQNKLPTLPLIRKIVVDFDSGENLELPTVIS